MEINISEPVIKELKTKLLNSNEFKREVKDVVSKYIQDIGKEIRKEIKETVSVTVTTVLESNLPPKMDIEKIVINQIVKTTDKKIATYVREKLSYNDIHHALVNVLQNDYRLALKAVKEL